MTDLGHEYTDLKYLDAGAFGHVYTAKNTADQKVVVKILWRGRNDELEARLNSSPNGKTLDEPDKESIEKVQTELRVMRLLNTQFNDDTVRIPTVYDLWPDETQPRAMVMEYIDQSEAAFVPATKLLDRMKLADSSRMAPFIPEAAVLAVTTAFLRMLAVLHKLDRYLDDAQLKNLCWNKQANQWRILDWNGSKPVKERGWYADPRSRDVWVVLAFAYQMLTGDDLFKRERDTIRPADLAKTPQWANLHPNIRRVLAYILCVPPGSQPYSADTLPIALKNELANATDQTLIDWVCAALQPGHHPPETDLRTTQAREALQLFRARDDGAYYATLPDVSTFPLESFSLADWRVFLLLRIVQPSRMISKDQSNLVLKLFEALENRGNTPADKVLIDQASSVYESAPAPLKNLVADVQREIKIRQNWTHMGQPLTLLENITAKDIIDLATAQGQLLAGWDSTVYQECLIRYLLDGEQPNPGIPGKDAAIARLNADVDRIQKRFELETKFKTISGSFEAGAFDEALKNWEALPINYKGEPQHLDVLHVALDRLLAPNNTTPPLEMITLLNRLARIIGNWEKRLHNDHTVQTALTRVWDFKIKAVAEFLQKGKFDEAFRVWPPLLVEQPLAEGHITLVTATLKAILDERNPSSAFSAFEGMQTIKTPSVTDIQTEQIERVQALRELSQAVTGGNLALVQTSLDKVTDAARLTPTPLEQAVIAEAEQLIRQQKVKQYRQWGLIGAAVAVIAIIVTVAAVIVSQNSQANSDAQTVAAVAAGSTQTSDAQVAAFTQVAFLQLTSTVEFRQGTATANAQATIDANAAKTQAANDTLTANAQKTLDAGGTSTQVAGLKLTPTMTFTASMTATPTQTQTPSATPTATLTPTASPTNTATPTPGPTSTPNNLSSLYSTDSSNVPSSLENVIAPDLIYNQPLVITADQVSTPLYFFGADEDHIELWCNNTPDVTVNLSTYTPCLSPVFNSSCKVDKATKSIISCTNQTAVGCITPNDADHTYHLTCTGIYQISNANPGIIALCADVRMLKRDSQTFADGTPDFAKNLCWQKSGLFKNTNRYRFFAIHGDQVTVSPGVSLNADAKILQNTVGSTTWSVSQETTGYINFWLSGEAPTNETVIVKNPNVYNVQPATNVRIRPELANFSLNFANQTASVDCTGQGCPVLYVSNNIFCFIRDAVTFNVGWLRTTGNCSTPYSKAPPPTVLPVPASKTPTAAMTLLGAITPTPIPKNKTPVASDPKATPS